MFRRRIQILALLFALIYTILLGQLVYLQIPSGPALRRQGEGRLHRLEQVPPRRGAIRDRNGNILAEDRPIWELWYTPGTWVRRDNRRTEALALGAVTLPRVRDLLAAHGPRRQHETNLAQAYLRDVHPLTDRLAAVLERPRAEVAEALLRAAEAAVADSGRWGLFTPRLLFRDIGNRAYLTILAAQRRQDRQAERFPGCELRGAWQRSYPYGEVTAHLTGYVGLMTAGDYERLRGYWGPEGPVEGRGEIPGIFTPTETESYLMRLYEITRQGRTIRAAGHLRNETIGKAGLERRYNQVLRGAHGLRHLRLSRPAPDSPRVMQIVGVNAPVEHGQELTLTLSTEIQTGVHRILQEHLETIRRRENRRLNGACVVLSPRDGAIQALVSLPSYNPAHVGERFREYTAPHNRKPLLNRAIRGIYPPGSTFKPIVALAALSSGAITPETEFDCQGLIRLGGHDFICMRRQQHGLLTVQDALRVSCNVFFYNAGRTVGPAELHAYASQLGIGKRTGIDLPFEHRGMLPEAARTGYRWAVGNTFHLSIGQGLAVTPLQMAVAISAIANGGTVVRPHLLADIADPTPAQREYLQDLRRPTAVVDLPADALAAVREGMWRVVQGAPDGGRGTGYRARLRTMDICGKSGSADWKKGEPTHAWFVAYAPAEAPEIVVVVIIPEGDLGGRTCAPIVQDILKLYFDIHENEGGLG